MKNIKFLFCSILVFTFSLSVSANADFHHKAKVELTKYQSSKILENVDTNFNEVSMLILNRKVPSISVNVPQVPFKNPPIFGDVDKMEVFCRKSEHFNFFKNQLLSRINVSSFNNKDYCYRINCYFRGYSIYLFRLC
jgi:hypothetical protein